MAAAGQVNLTGTVDDLPSGAKVIGPLTFTAAAALDATVQVVLASGANTVTVPTGATMVIIVFDPASTTDKTLKGVTGDTGIKSGPTGFVCFPVNAISSFCITSSAADTSKTTTIMFV